MMGLLEAPLTRLYGVGTVGYILAKGNLMKKMLASSARPVAQLLVPHAASYSGSVAGANAREKRREE